MAIRCYGVMGFGDLRAKLDCLMKSMVIYLMMCIIYLNKNGSLVKIVIG